MDVAFFVCSILSIWDMLLRSERQSGCRRPGHLNGQRGPKKLFQREQRSAPLCTTEDGSVSAPL